LRLLLVFAALTAVGLGQGSTAIASPPDNDNFADAQAVSSLPFTDGGDLGGTTAEPGEPQYCNYQVQTVWYSFTPSTTTAVRLNLNGSDGGVVANVFRSFGGGFGGLSFAGCIGYGGSTQFTAQAGTTHYIQAGSVFGGSARLQLNLDSIPPPPNDDFANARTVGALPYFDSVDRTAASMESGEPAFPACGSISHTVWYSYTATESGTLWASGNAAGVSSFIAVYTGDSLANLSAVSCASEGNLFRAVAGRTYLIQVGSNDGQDGAPQSFRLQVAPTPSVAPFVSTTEPSIYDTAQFYVSVFDPANGAVSSYRWDFGDGTGADGCCPTHRYGADGQYTAKVTVTMADGRTATGSIVVNVKTHDVAITKMTVPQSASAGQNRAITISVINKRYPETVQVQLSKSVPGGFAPVGTLTLSVSAGKSVDFKFSYVFTAEDAAIGKVSFQATATIVGARDALPADNSVTALQTKVR
jgi:PKD repeat protein